MARIYDGKLGPFDFRVSELMPSEWSGPVIDVIDTAQTVEMGIQDKLDIEPTVDLILGLTRLVMEEHARREAQERLDD
jgi:hypothetical protein